MLFTYKYLSPEQLKGFDRYKYSSVDNSPLSVYIMHPFWNAVVKYVPTWVAPNLLTFLGFLLLVVMYVTLCAYDWHFLAGNRLETSYPAIPAGVWFFCAFCQFTAHTLDGIDGKQARRTGSSSPLGELFDHGSDSMVATMLPLALFSVFGYGMEDDGGNEWIFFTITWNIIGQFVISHWEKYLTGVLFLPWGYDIAQVSMTIVYILTGIFTNELWKGSLYGIQLNYAFVVAVVAGSVFHALPQSIYNVYRSYKDGTGKNRSFYDAAEPMFPIFTLFVVSLLWGLYSPTNLILKEMRTFYSTFGIIMSNICCRLIISQMSDTRAPWFNSSLALYSAVALVSCLGNLGSTETALLYATFNIVLVVQIHYAGCVVNQLAEHFGIYPLTLGKRVKNHVK